jgi:hypothetical protein
VTTPGDEQPDSLAEGQAALFASMADARLVGIIRYLGDGERRTLAQIAVSVGADRLAVRDRIATLRGRGLLAAHYDTAFTRYSVRDIRILQLLELATELVATKAAPEPAPVVSSPRARAQESLRRESCSSPRVRVRASLRPKAR